MKKIKVFLGAYINSSNAQNLNCRALALYLNKNKFDIISLNLYSGNLDTKELKDVELINVFYPHRISKYIAYSIGIIKCDIAYLPKGELPRYTIFLAKLFRKKTFSTVEGVLNDQFISFCKKERRDPFKPINYWKSIDYLFPITKYIGTYMSTRYGLQFEHKTLYLGIDTKSFYFPEKKMEKLENIVLIGNALKEKGIYEYLKLAKMFPNLNFHIIGSGHDLDNKNNLFNGKNIYYHGMLSHDELSSFLKKMHLHVLFSKTEGFPKVVIETASAGIPSIMYDHYGADEWMTDSINCFIIHKFEESYDIIRDLISNPNKLKVLSKNAVKLSENFSWEKQIKNWEQTIISIYER